MIEETLFFLYRLIKKIIQYSRAMNNACVQYYCALVSIGFEHVITFGHMSASSDGAKILS